MHKNLRNRVLRSRGLDCQKINLEMASKSTIFINPLKPPVVDVEHTPLADVDYKITDPVIEYNLLGLQY